MGVKEDNIIIGYNERDENNVYPCIDPLSS